jgi:hypothetical protein
MSLDYFDQSDFWTGKFRLVDLNFGEFCDKPGWNSGDFKEIIKSNKMNLGNAIGLKQKYPFYAAKFLIGQTIRMSNLKKGFNPADFETEELKAEKASPFYPLRKVWLRWEAWSAGGMLETWEKFFVSNITSIQLI